MTDKLVQKSLLHGTQELELTEDTLRVTTSGPFRAKKVLDFVLATLDPDPVVNKDRLEFYGRVKCGPMLSLYLDKPDPASFSAFVEKLKAQARAEYGDFTGWKDRPEQ
jgi:hypothetical protein